MAAPVSLAGVDDLADWIGEAIPFDTPDYKRAEWCIRAASALVRAESGRTWLDADGSPIDPIPENAVMVTIYCAGRIYDNREAQTRGGVDDYTESWRVDESGAYLTASEKRMLSGLKPSGRRGIGTIATTRAEYGVDGTGWVPTPTPNVMFPWY